MYNWGISDYVEDEKRLLTEEEQLGGTNNITTFAAIPTKFSQYYSKSNWKTRSDGIT